MRRLGIRRKRAINHEQYPVSHGHEHWIVTTASIDPGGLQHVLAAIND